MTQDEAKSITAYFDSKYDKVDEPRHTDGMSLSDLVTWMVDPARTDLEVVMAWKPFSDAQLSFGCTCEEHTAQMTRLLQAGVTDRICDAVLESRRQFPWKKQ